METGKRKRSPGRPKKNKPDGTLKDDIGNIIKRKPGRPKRITTPDEFVIVEPARKNVKQLLDEVKKINSGKKDGESGNNQERE